MKNKIVEDGYQSLKILLSWKNPHLLESVIERQIDRIKSTDLRREKYSNNYQLEIKRRLTDIRKTGRQTISLDELKQYLDKSSPGYTFTHKELERLTGKSGLRLETKQHYGSLILNIPCIFDCSDWYKGESLFLPITYYSEEYLLHQLKFNRDHIDRFNKFILAEIGALVVPKKPEGVIYGRQPIA